MRVAWLALTALAATSACARPELTFVSYEIADSNVPRGIQLRSGGLVRAIDRSRPESTGVEFDGTLTPTALTRIAAAVDEVEDRYDGPFDECEDCFDEERYGFVEEGTTDITYLRHEADWRPRGVGPLNDVARAILRQTVACAGGDLVTPAADCTTLP